MLAPRAPRPYPGPFFSVMYPSRVPLPPVILGPAAAAPPETLRHVSLLNRLNALQPSARPPPVFLFQASRLSVPPSETPCSVLFDGADFFAQHVGRPLSFPLSLSEPLLPTCLSNLPCVPSCLFFQCCPHAGRRMYGSALFYLLNHHPASLSMLCTCFPAACNEARQLWC